MTELEASRRGVCSSLLSHRLFTQVMIPALIGNTNSSVSTTESGGPEIALNLLASDVVVEDPSAALRCGVARHQPQCSAVKGGLLCDEPGLGKSVTLLAVILKSLGNKTTGQPDMGKCNKLFLQNYGLFFLLRSDIRFSII
jgi:hypothetical protein